MGLECQRNEEFLGALCQRRQRGSGEERGENVIYVSAPAQLTGAGDAGGVDCVEQYCSRQRAKLSRNPVPRQGMLTKRPDADKVM